MLNEFHSSDGLQLIFFSQRIIFDGTSDPMGAYTSCIRSFFKSTVRNYTHFQWNNENSEAEKGMKSVEIHSVHSTLAYIKCRAKPSHSVCVDIDNRHRKQCLPNTQSNTMFVARVKNKKRHKKAGQNPFEMLLSLSKHEHCEHEQQGARACVFLIIVVRRTFCFICCIYIVKFMYSRRISLSTATNARDEEEYTEKLM